MKIRPWSIGILLFGCAAVTACVTTTRYQAFPNRPPVTEVAPPENGSDQPFYDDLAPYGRWFYAEGPGWVWSPNAVQAGWRPYLLGHWVFTDQGWTWASDEQWGWAAYHYGRWHQDPGYGWVWVPGTEWGPAWVAWHEGGGYVGWTPLPWQVTVRAGVGLDWGGVDVSLEPSSWCFVSARHLVDPGLRYRIEPPARNVTLIQVTRNVTNYTYIDNRIVNRGVRVEAIDRAAGHKIPRYRVRETESAEMTRGGKVRGEEFPVYRPEPRRAQASHGRAGHTGHDERERPRDYRAVPAPPETTPPAGAPSGPPPSAQAPPDQPRENKSQHGHEYKVFDELRGRKQPHHSPRPATQAQPATPAQPGAPEQHAAPAQPTTPDQHSAPEQHTTPAQPAAAEQHAAPANSAATPMPDKARPGKARGKGRKNDAPKTEQSKPDTSKSEESDADNSKTEKPESNH
jgi:hypothetical protein